MNLRSQLLDCLFETDSQQRDWGEEGYEEMGRRPVKPGPTIATTETHVAGEISFLDQVRSVISFLRIVLLFFDFIRFVSLFFVMQISLFHICIVITIVIMITVSPHRHSP